jgi:dihydrofolate synthase/folylpolyglutamate synthase
MLSAMLPDAGLYTSPHLVRLNERIRIGSEEISDTDLKAVFEHVKKTADSAKDLLYPPTYFEIVTAMAFCHFQRKGVRLAVVEVGMGGRLDATNVVRQDVSVITTIGLDHQEFLGSTLEQIAGEKAGIIKDGEPVVVGPGVDFKSIEERAGTRLIKTESIAKSVRSLGNGYFEFDLPGLTALRPRLAGRHQVENAVIAVRAAQSLGINSEQIRTGIETAVWPGRLERFVGAPAFLLDGAHNIPAMEALASFLKEFNPQGVWMIFAAMADKQIERMLEIIHPYVTTCIFTRAQTGRAKDPNDLAALVPGSVVQPSLGAAIAYARSHAPASATVLICGSLYLIGEARPMLQ